MHYHNNSAVSAAPAAAAASDAAATAAAAAAAAAAASVRLLRLEASPLLFARHYCALREERRVGSPQPTDPINPKR